MIRNWLAGFYFYADDTLSSPGLSVLLALDFLAVFSELDQLFTRHRVHGLNQLRRKLGKTAPPNPSFWIKRVDFTPSVPRLLTEGHAQKKKKDQ